MSLQMEMRKCPGIIARDELLSKVWLDIVYWYDELNSLEDEEKQKHWLRSNACFLQLAHKTMSSKLKKTMEAGEKDKFAAFHALKYLLANMDTLAKHPVVHEIYQWGESSFQISVPRARALVVAHVPKGLERFTVQLSLLKDMRRIWRTLDHYIASMGDNVPKTVDGNIIARQEVRKRLAWLEAAVEDQENPTKAQKGSDANGEDDEAGKKGDEADDEGEAVIMASLAMNLEDHPLLKWYSQPASAASSAPPIVAAPAIPGHKDIAGLVGQEWLTDLIIDPYLALLCHDANGHFQMLEAEPNLPGSPKWHAWSALFIGALAKGKTSAMRAWPSKPYPNAKIEDVMYHVFPFNLRENHWGVAILHKQDGGWRLNWYSSIPGYTRDFVQAWPKIAAFLDSKTVEATKFGELPVNEPEQPVQTGSDDCGVFVCCIVRWMMKRWPISTLKSGYMQTLRWRIAADLHQWRL